MSRGCGCDSPKEKHSDGGNAECLQPCQEAPGGTSHSRLEFASTPMSSEFLENGNKESRRIPFPWDGILVVPLCTVSEVCIDYMLRMLTRVQRFGCGQAITILMDSVEMRGH